MSVSTSILLYGRDHTLQLTRSLILQKAGYDVFSAENTSEVNAVSLAHSVCLIVICQTVSHEEERMALAVALAFHPHATVLTFNGSDDQYNDRRYSPVHEQGIGSSMLAAQFFLTTVEGAIRHHKEVNATRTIDPEF